MSDCKCSNWMKKENVSFKINTMYPQSFNMVCGVIMINKSENAVLMVQVYESFLGFPKGHSEEIDENNPMNTAIREVFEETGIRLTKEDLIKSEEVFIHNHQLFFIVYTDTNPDINFAIGHDVTACGWIHIDCLYNLQPFTAMAVKRFLDVYKKRRTWPIFDYKSNVVRIKPSNIFTFSSLSEYSYLNYNVDLNAFRQKWWNIKIPSQTISSSKSTTSKSFSWRREV